MLSNAGTITDKSASGRGSVQVELHPPDVTLTDENTGVVDRFCETRLEYLGLESSLHEVFDLEGEYVIETHSSFVEYSNSY